MLIIFPRSFSMNPLNPLEPYDKGAYNDSILIAQYKKGSAIYRDSCVGIFRCVIVKCR